MLRQRRLIPLANLPLLRQVAGEIEARKAPADQEVADLVAQKAEQLKAVAELQTKAAEAKKEAEAKQQAAAAGALELIAAALQQKPPALIPRRRFAVGPWRPSVVKEKGGKGRALEATDKSE